MTERVLRAESLAKQGQQELQRAEEVRMQMQKDLEEANLERWVPILAMNARSCKKGRSFRTPLLHYHLLPPPSCTSLRIFGINLVHYAYSCLRFMFTQA